MEINAEEKYLTNDYPQTDHLTECISWKELSQRFKKVRGIGVGYRTIQGWQASGMPYIKDHRFYWYRWDECLEWWITNHAVRRTA